MINKTITDS